MARQRLQKILASAGVGSRRKCEQLILDGSVSVNHEAVNSLPAFADSEKDLITVNGQKIIQAPRIYFLLNKPKGVVCTNLDPSGRKKAIDLVPSKQRIFCAGRLDADTTGLILISNDSELTNRLTHPKYELSKTYVVTVRGRIGGGQVEKLKKGIWLAETKTKRSSVKILKRGLKESVLQIVIRQGLNRQVRRMLARVGFKVKSLKRTKIGKIELRGIGVGKCRPLKKSELAYLNSIKSPRTVKQK
ncbi:MAG: pseudouridine synthase [Planctomycetota bacterium]|jgi:23S rRNA pseudouridine2605 synthase